MRVLFNLLFVILLTFKGISQSLYFPPTSTDDWDTLSLSEIGWCADQLPPLFDFLEASNTKAFIVLKDGKIVIEKYFDSFTQDSTWYWASAGKTLTAFMIGKAQEEGILSISDTTASHLGTGWTSLTNTQEEKITIRHQLTMTSGLDDGVLNVNCTTPNCLVYKADPGSRWAYHNAPYTLLQDVVESASGTNFNVYLNPRLKVPTGMDGLFLPVGFNSVYFSKPRSMARFGLLMLNNGNWNGTQILNDMTYLNDMITPSQSINNAYGYLWWLNGQSSYMLPGLQFMFSGLAFPHAPADVYAAMGKNGQILNVSPSKNLVMIRMGNNPDNSLVPNYYCDTIWQKLNPVMCGIAQLDDQPETKPTIVVYPNPSEGWITLRGIEHKSALLLYDLDGRLVWKKFVASDMNNVQIPEHLSKGIYLMRITSEGVDQTQKFILR